MVGCLHDEVLMVKGPLLQSTDLFIGQIEQQRDLGRQQRLPVCCRPLQSFCLTSRHAQRPIPATTTVAAKPLDLQSNGKLFGSSGDLHTIFRSSRILMAGASGWLHQFVLTKRNVQSELALVATIAVQLARCTANFDSGFADDWVLSLHVHVIPSGSVSHQIHLKDKDKYA